MVWFKCKIEYSENDTHALFTRETWERVGKRHENGKCFYHWWCVDLYLELELIHLTDQKSNCSFLLIESLLSYKYARLFEKYL